MGETETKTESDSGATPVAGAAVTEPTAEERGPLTFTEALSSPRAWAERREHLDVAAKRALFATLFGTVTGALIGYNRGMAELASLKPIVVPRNKETNLPSAAHKLQARRRMYLVVSRQLGQQAVLTGSKVGLIASLFCGVEVCLGQARQVSADDPVNVTVAGAVTGTITGAVQAGVHGMRAGAVVGAGTAAVFAAITALGNWATAGIREEVEEELLLRRASRQAEEEAELEKEFGCDLPSAGEPVTPSTSAPSEK
mmetsp:Transcript_2039/g.7384  ORF Transcript_2039/g.7384 Transcript_2039/m.7384 type:complete len:256 (+) Transcript_2039:66-833(+)